MKNLSFLVQDKTGLGLKLEGEIISPPSEIPEIEISPSILDNTMALSDHQEKSNTAHYFFSSF